MIRGTPGLLGGGGGAGLAAGGGLGLLLGLGFKGAGTVEDLEAAFGEEGGLRGMEEGWVRVLWRFLDGG